MITYLIFQQFMALKQLRDSEEQSFLENNRQSEEFQVLQEKVTWMTFSSLTSVIISSVIS